VAIFNGVGRVLVVALIVTVLQGWAAGTMIGVLAGLVAALGFAARQNHDLWREPGAPFDSLGWLRRVVPLTLGFGAGQFIFSADAIVVQNYLGNGGVAAPYMFGGTLARGIVLFTGPLAAVMFPKLVHSAARAQKNELNFMALTLLGTAVLSSLAAIGLTLTAPLIIKFVSNPDYVSIVPLIPLFAWSMVPLAVALVLLNNLMAHSRFKVVPAAVLVAIGYWVALQYFHDSFKTVIETFGVFSLLFLAVCSFFTWGIKK
jgi:O-antigen/teichoic acid export membrane protein